MNGGEGRIAVRIKDIEKSYGQMKVLNGASLDVPKGRLVFLLGRNGGGKSTLLHCVAGLLPFERGFVEFDVDVQGRGDEKDPLQRKLEAGKRLDLAMRKEIGIVFQHSALALWPHMTAVANVADPYMRLCQKSEVKASDRARELLRELRLDKDSFEKFPGQLSGGEQQCIAIARAVCARPAVLLLDQVTDHLDPAKVAAVLRMLKRDFIAGPHHTVILVTHSIELLTMEGDAVVVEDNGTLTNHGSSREFLDSEKLRKSQLFVGVGPGSYEFLCGRQTLRAASELMDAVLRCKDLNELLQSIAQTVSHMLEEVNPGSAHLVLLVVRETELAPRRNLRGACATTDFLFDGKDAQAVLGGIIQEVEVGEVQLIPGGKRVTKRLRLNPERIRSATQGVPFEKGGLIASMFAGKEEDFEPVQGHPILGVSRTDIQNMPKNKKKSYYEFSTGTKQVYRVSMESEGVVLGVLSIDTSEEEAWSGFVARNVKLIANLGALVMTQRQGRGPAPERAEQVAP